MEKIYKIILTFVFFSLFPVGVNAANLSFSPSSGSYPVGGVLSVSVFVSSSDQAMNASDGVISFPKDKLEAISVSKSGSIFSLWVQEPSFSNIAGTVNFEGVVLNPGFVGSSGKIATISFKVKTPGVANLSFLSGSVLANDGQGTNILKTLGTAQFSLDSNGPTVPESTTPTIVYGTPSAPDISSPTHPNSNIWYAKDGATFEWKVPVDVTATRLSFGELPRSTPTVTYPSKINEKEIKDLSDGIKYFHAQFRNEKGWGEISHFRFQIDTEKPEHFNITEVQKTDAVDPIAKFVFDAKDKTSGIDYFEIQIDGGDPVKWHDDKSKTYSTPVLASGKHTLIAKAVDRAGNFLITAAEFAIASLEPPEITDYPKELPSGEILTAKGETYTNSKVTIWLQKDKEDEKSFIVKSGTDGKFTFISDDGMKDGVYKLWAEVEDERGAKSLPSEKLTVKVLQSAFFRIGSWVVSFFALLIPLLALLIVIIIIVWYSWHKFFLLRKKVRKETREATSAVTNSFNLLRENIQETIKILEKTHTKRELTKEEEKILKQFKKDLEDAERFVKKEVEDIGKLVK